MSPASPSRPSKAERTVAAREKARQIREEQQKKEKRNKLLLRWGVVVALLAVGVIVALVVISTIRSNAPIPDKGPTAANTTQYGGVVLDKDGVVESDAGGDVDVTALAAPASAPVSGGGASVADLGIAASAKDEPVKVVAYVDFICPACRNFEEQNSELLRQQVADGKITLEYRPFGLLDKQSTTNYSSRAANAAAAVANSNPEKYVEFFDALYAQQPAEGGSGLSDEKLKEIAKGLGVDISKAVDEKTYRPAVNYTTKQAANAGVLSSPSVFVDGKQYGQGDSAEQEFSAFLQAALDAKATK